VPTTAAAVTTTATAVTALDNCALGVGGIDPDATERVGDAVRDGCTGRMFHAAHAVAQRMLYQRLKNAGELVAVIFAVGPVVLVVVLEHARPAAHTFRMTVGADGAAVLACLRVDGPSHPRHERWLAYSVWDRAGLGFELHCQHWRTGRLIYVGLLHLSVKISVADVVNVRPRVHEPQHGLLVLLAPNRYLILEQLPSVLVFWAEGRVLGDRGPRAQLQHAASILGLVSWPAARLISHLPRA
jgi:hypothetical protein